MGRSPMLWLLSPPPPPLPLPHAAANRPLDCEPCSFASRITQMGSCPVHGLAGGGWLQTDCYLNYTAPVALTSTRGARFSGCRHCNNIEWPPSLAIQQATMAAMECTASGSQADDARWGPTGAFNAGLDAHRRRLGSCSWCGQHRQCALIAARLPTVCIYPQPCTTLHGATQFEQTQPVAHMRAAAPAWPRRGAVGGQHPSNWPAPGARNPLHTQLSACAASAPAALVSALLPVVWALWAPSRSPQRLAPCTPP